MRFLGYTKSPWNPGRLYPRFVARSLHPIQPTIETTKTHVLDTLRALQKLRLLRVSNA